MKIIDVSYEVWMWVHQKYWMSQLVCKFYPLKTNNWSYLAVNDYGRLDQQKNEKMTCNEQKVK